MVKMVEGVILIGNEVKMATGIGATPEQQKVAQITLATTLTSLPDLAELAQDSLRLEEYQEAFAPGEHGQKAGYVLGKSYYDFAKIVLGVGLMKKTAKAAASNTALWLGETLLHETAENIAELKAEIEENKNN